MHQSHNHTGTVGKMQEYSGTMFVEVPVERWEKIEECVVRDEDLVPETVVMNELGIGKKTLANLMWCGRITRKMYTVAVNGRKFFRNKMILGLKK